MRTHTHTQSVKKKTQLFFDFVEVLLVSEKNILLNKVQNMYIDFSWLMNSYQSTLYKEVSLLVECWVVIERSKLTYFY